jgi:hypothetical protein
LLTFQRNRIDKCGDADQGSQPIANSDTPKENTGTENCANGRGVSALDETLQVRTMAMPGDAGDGASKTHVAQP